MSSTIDRLLRRLAANRPTRLIEVGGAPYLARVYLWHWGGWRVYLHRFISCDGDRFMHDHPFHAFSVVLSGGYSEERMVTLDMPAPAFKVRQVRWLNWIPAKTFHRIASTLPGTWTLFVNSPHRKQWGFLYPQADGGVLYKNPFDDEGQGNGAHWWESAPRFSELGL